MIGADQDRDITDPLSGVNPLSGDLSLRDQGYKVTGASTRHPTLYMSLVMTRCRDEGGRKRCMMMNVEKDCAVCCRSWYGGYLN